MYLGLGLNIVRQLKIGVSVSISAGSIPELSAQATTLATLTPTGVTGAGAISLSAITPAGTLQMNADGRRVEAGATRIDYGVATQVTATITYTHSTGTYIGPITFFVIRSAIALGATPIATPFANLTTGVAIALDLRTLFTAISGWPQTYTSNVGTIAGDTFTLNWTPSYNDWLLYGQFSRLSIFITATDGAGRTGATELLNQGIDLVNTAPVGANKTLPMDVLQGSAATLTLPTDIDTSGSSANVGATTNRSTGILYTAVTATSTPPTAAQIKAGTGGGILFAGNAAVTATGVRVAAVNGLSPATAYFGHAMHETAGGIQSNVVTGDGFTTSALSAPAQFGTGDWAATDTKSGDGTYTLAITTLPANGGSAITALQVQMDGGAWNSVGGTTTGNYTITGVYNVATVVSVRAVNAIGNGVAAATKSVTPRGIRFVGFRPLGGTGATSSGAINAGLTGGSRAAVATDDYVAAALCWAAGTNDTIDITTASFTDYYAEDYINGGNDLNSVAAFSVQGATPDTAVGGTGSNNGGKGQCLIIMLFEGVDITTPHDVAPVIGTGVNNSVLSQPPAISPSTAGTVILTISMGGYGAAALDAVAPSNMTSIGVRKTETATRSSYALAAYTRWNGSGAFTPNAVTLSAGSDSASHTAKSITVALRPA
jgi:hypothetical protein